MGGEPISEGREAHSSLHGDRVHRRADAHLDGLRGRRQEEGVPAVVGAVGRVVVPILLQQAIDRGIIGEEGVDVGLVAMLAVMLFAVLMGVLGGLLPALRGARLPITSALRSE